MVNNLLGLTASNNTKSVAVSLKHYQIDDYFKTEIIPELLFSI